MKTKILYEDEALFIIHKPAGLAVQSARVGQMDVESELRNYMTADARKKGMKGAGNPYIGLVHRLDQPVEGLLAVAKTKEAAAVLTKQLSLGTLNKQYLAVVYLQNTQALQEASFQDYMIKDGQLAKIVTKDTIQAKEARLQYCILQKSAADDGREVALVQIHIETGRFHQIRCQMAYHGMPLLGDVKYGTEASMAISHVSGIRQTALCADYISLKHPKNGKILQFKIQPENAAFSRFFASL